MILYTSLDCFSPVRLLINTAQSLPKVSDDNCADYPPTVPFVSGIHKSQMFLTLTPQTRTFRYVTNVFAFSQAHVRKMHAGIRPRLHLPQPLIWSDPHNEHGFKCLYITFKSVFTDTWYSRTFEVYVDTRQQFNKKIKSLYFECTVLHFFAIDVYFVSL
ncbi:uncharacterized protein LOC111041521 [Myzus persicae]|uniref:uncharacterized protein LOC111041521 n=1 Tax=Myzus persicae TaxID=13164 RepID=UPI000B930286|nr:uncharacterized protein LOC111041521 [Myzus persicae]